MDDCGSLSWRKDYCRPAIGVIVVEVGPSVFVCEVAVAELCVAI